MREQFTEREMVGAMIYPFDVWFKPRQTHDSKMKCVFVFSMPMIIIAFLSCSRIIYDAVDIVHAGDPNGIQSIFM